ncbi:MAG: hypothetical protein KDD94_14580, partial [Calditrichaeota bacterium]|nr:hypothetical protein [Calditrichota bacterium]
EPRLKYGSKLHFQFQSQKYVKSVYMDKWIEVLDDASQFSHHLFFYNQETYNSIIQTFSSENFLEPIIWENNFGYSDTVIRIDFDDPQSSKEYELIIWLIWNPELQQSFPVEKKSTKQLSDLHQRFVKKN